MSALVTLTVISALLFISAIVVAAGNAIEKERRRGPRDRAAEPASPDSSARQTGQVDEVKS